MKLQSGLRKTLSSVIIAGLLAVSLPAVSTAGGCDEPGYTGGTCAHRDSCTPQPPLPVIQPPGKDKRPALPPVLDLIGMNKWLGTILSGLIR